jgi:hypothetical protein
MKRAILFRFIAILSGQWCRSVWSKRLVEASACPSAGPRGATTVPFGWPILLHADVKEFIARYSPKSHGEMFVIGCS